MPFGRASNPPAEEFPSIVAAAWNELGRRDRIATIQDLSANVSTNQVYRVRLGSGKEVIAKTSSYGSYPHFRQDHRIIKQWIRHLGGTRFRRFLADVLTKDGQVFTYREGHVWVVFYQKAPFYDFLPRVLTDPQVEALGREMAAFHQVSTDVSPKLMPSWKSLGSDAATLYDALGSAEWRAARGFNSETESFLRRHCDTFFSNAERLGYHRFTQIPVLVDWNIGNFSVGFDGDGFKLFSRWDYDWFRLEPRVLDFYFCARVVRSEGDKTLFSYTTQPLFESRFLRFLRAYHEVFPLSEEELLFLKEAYRFFLLNYVIRVGEHFFREQYCRRLQRETVEDYLPQLERTDFYPLLRAVLD